MKQKLHHLQTATKRRSVERCILVQIARVNVGIAFQQQPRHLDMAILLKGIL
ncbi:hypothetical protein HK405_011472, partial [Cladochytrium tenue]